jgi:hypothetical protein
MSLKNWIPPFATIFISRRRNGTRDHRMALGLLYMKHVSVTSVSRKGPVHLPRDFLFRAINKHFKIYLQDKQ